MADHEIDQLAMDANDHEWWLATGCCGGCGSPDCHRRKACTGPECTRCPSRDTPDN